MSYTKRWLEDISVDMGFGGEITPDVEHRAKLISDLDCIAETDAHLRDAMGLVFGSRFNDGSPYLESDDKWVETGRLEHWLDWSKGYGPGTIDDRYATLSPDEYVDVLEAIRRTAPERAAFDREDVFEGYSGPDKPRLARVKGFFSRCWQRLKGWCT